MGILLGLYKDIEKEHGSYCSRGLRAGQVILSG